MFFIFMVNDVKNKRLLTVFPFVITAGCGEIMNLKIIFMYEVVLGFNSKARLRDPLNSINNNCKHYNSNTSDNNK